MNKTIEKSQQQKIRKKGEPEEHWGERESQRKRRAKGEK